MSKKGAESLSALVLDVKYGKAALTQDIESARALAQSLVMQKNPIAHPSPSHARISSLLTARPALSHR